jgi:hypothetical protein
MSAQAYPLHWPPGFPRWRYSRSGGAFRTGFDDAVKNVRKSLEAFARDSGKAIGQPVLSSNIDFNPLTVRNPNKRPNDPGVAVWFVWDGISVCIAVDRYDNPAANLQAIHHIIEARRVELRHGTLALVRATFEGFKALPPPKRWQDVLEYHKTPASKHEIEENYKRIARSRHPDAGGSVDAMAELNNARDTAMREIGDKSNG